MMYVILVYDVEQSRVAKVCKRLRQSLNWVQNSAFEGELTESQLEEVRLWLEGFLDLERDSVYIYKLRSHKAFDKEVIGVEKSPEDQLI